MKLQEAIERLLVATVADGRSPATGDQYRRRLAGLADFLGPDTDVASITAHDLRRYVASLRSRRRRWAHHAYREEVSGGLSPATIAGHVRAIKRLFNFLQADGIIADNAGKGLRTPRLPKGREPKAVSLEDLLSLLAVTEGGEPAQLRDRALLLFLADTGARVGGLVGLGLADLDLESGTAWVIEKGSKRRAVYLSAMTCDALQAWLQVRPEGSQAVFVRLIHGEGLPLQSQGVTQILRRLKKTAGVSGPCNPHAFRHAFAREYLRNGGDLATLSDLLGHTDIAVTALHYAVYLPSELQERHKRYSPIAQLGRNGET